MQTMNNCNTTAIQWD